MTKNQIKAILITVGSNISYSGRTKMFYFDDKPFSKENVITQIIIGLAHYFDYAITFNGVEDTVTYDKFRNALGEHNHLLMLEYGKADKTLRDLEEKLSKLSWDTEEYQIFAGMLDAANDNCIKCAKLLYR